MQDKFSSLFLSIVLAASGLSPAAASQQSRGRDFRRTAGHGEDVGVDPTIVASEAAGEPEARPLEGLDVQLPVAEGVARTDESIAGPEALGAEVRTEVKELTKRTVAIVGEAGELGKVSPGEAHATGRALADMRAPGRGEDVVLSDGLEEVLLDQVNMIPSKDVQDRIAGLGKVFEQMFAEAEKKVVGQRDVLRTVVETFMAKGNIVLEGVPGTAKTLMAETLAFVTGLKVEVVRMTPDLTAADLVGFQDHRTGQIVMGPMLRANIIILDELNRGAPKTKSAVLSLMQEHKAKIFNTSFQQMDGSFPDPYLVIATMNPLESEGVNPLVEAEKDRYLAHKRVKYPGFQQEKQIGRQSSTGYNPTLRHVLSGGKVAEIQALVRQAYISPTLEDYITAVVRATRPSREEDGFVNDVIDLKGIVKVGAGTRGVYNLMLAARARAVVAGRWNVTVDDVQAVMKDVLRLRIIMEPTARARGFTEEKVLDAIRQKINPYDPLGEDAVKAPARKRWFSGLRRWAGR